MTQAHLLSAGHQLVGYNQDISLLAKSKTPAVLIG